MNFESIKNLIFDLDGTLIDSSEGVIEATNFGLRAIGDKERTGDEIKKFIGYPLKEMFDSFSKESYSEFWDHFQFRAKESVVASAVALDGADRVVRELSARGYNLSIGTTKIRIHIEKIMQKYGWTDLIQFYAGADDVKNVKPHPEVFLQLLDKLSGSTSNTLVIGDTANDVYAAHRASLPIIAVKSAFGRDGDLEISNPDLMIERLDDLLDILK